MRDLVLLALHLTVYVVVIGGIVFFVGGFGAGPLGLGYDSFDAIFWPSYLWGTLVAAQAGATVFQRRRFMGAVLGAMASVLLGTWVLGQIAEYQVTAIVFRSIAVALIALALGVSLVRRPPAFMLAEAPLATRPRSSGPVLAPTRRVSMVSFSNVLLGMVALVFVLAAIANGTYRALEVRGSGEMGQRLADVAPFDRLSVSGLGQLTIIPGDQTTLSISGDENLLDYIDVRSVDGELQVGFDPGSRGPARLEQPLVYVVTMPALSGLTLGGSVDASIDPAFGIGSLRVVADDQARLTANDLFATSLSASVRDQATLTLFGQVELLAVEADDDAVVDLEGLTAENVSVTARAAAHVSLGEAETLWYQQSGGALIECSPGTQFLPGSEAEVPQCASPPEADRQGGTTIDPIPPLTMPRTPTDPESPN